MSGVDRYHLADGYHQVMLATRELSPQLPAQAQTWVNHYLQFTYGYDVVMNFVSKKVGGGFPQYLIENVPAEAVYGLNITQPAISLMASQCRVIDRCHRHQGVRLPTGHPGAVP